jgi:F-type H+-transporting ATPase subunit a
MFPFFSPLEQFSVYSATSAILGGSIEGRTPLEITTITNTVVIFLIGLFVLTTFQIASSSHLIKPTRWNMILEAWIASILGIVKDQMGNTTKSLVFFPLIFTFFSFVFISNILGMVPYSFTPTSHISVTLGLSLAIMIGVTLNGFERHQLDFFSLFIPKGTPLGLVPLLVLIEFISYSARAFSLALRLTANVSAGHCLFGVISMLIISAAGSVATLVFKGLTLSFPLLILVPLYGLELLVAILQSYVFTLLTCSYLNDILGMGDH